MEEVVWMGKKDLFKYRVIEDFREGRITREMAATLLGICLRTVTRLTNKVRAEGLSGLLHHNRGRPPSNKLNPSLKTTVMELVDKKYFDFNMTHCLEMLAEHENITIGYSTFRRWCHEAHKVKRPKTHRAKKRVYRERMANEGLLLQMDGSHHAWNGSSVWCLIGAIDDATSIMPAAKFYATEDLWSCFDLIKEIIQTKGIPQALYVDRAGWFGGLQNQQQSQFVRACSELGIRVIHANSPEAKGRIERAWQTFQDRLIPELRLRGIKNMQEANEYLSNTFLPNYWNQKNIVEPEKKTSRYRTPDESLDLEQVFCLKEFRVVQKDQTVAYANQRYRVDTRLWGSLAKRQIEFRVYRDGSWQAFWGRRKLSLKKIIYRRYWHLGRQEKIPA